MSTVYTSRIKKATTVSIGISDLVRAIVLYTGAMCDRECMNVQSTVAVFLWDTVNSSVRGCFENFYPKIFPGYLRFSVVVLSVCLFFKYLLSVLL